MRVHSLRPFLARTIINGPSVPEALYASAQTHRRRNRETFDPAARLANSNGKLHCEYECKDFVTAFSNMTRVALIAESMNHHPEWFNVWNKVVIDLVTHSVKGISDLDFVLADKVQEVFAPSLAKHQKSGS